MLDQYEYMTDRDIERSVHRCRLEKAINRTRKLIGSTMAADNPTLRKIWEAKLERQLENFAGVCKF